VNLFKHALKRVIIMSYNYHFIKFPHQSILSTIFCINSLSFYLPLLRQTGHLFCNVHTSHSCIHIHFSDVPPIESVEISLCTGRGHTLSKHVHKPGNVPKNDQINVITYSTLWTQHSTAQHSTAQHSPSTIQRNT
jgi:hypothetical protein